VALCKSIEATRRAGFRLCATPARRRIPLGRSRCRNDGHVAGIPWVTFAGITGHVPGITGHVGPEYSTIERLLPCIVDNQPLPRDLVQSAVRRTCNRIALDHWEWEKTLGIACALFKGTLKNEEYQMSLENDRRSRDYLYGRLLALAENIESYALTNAEMNRETSAARLMQRFSDHPASTWRSIELALCPYKTRLRSTDKGRGFLIKREKLVDEIMSLFVPEDFLSPRSLTGEFLLGYHCQRDALKFVPKPEILPPAEVAQIQ
jgi:CRISPR-associated protein Csd1